MGLLEKYLLPHKATGSRRNLSVPGLQTNDHRHLPPVGARV